MSPNRKSIAKLTKSGLRKCTQFYKDGVHAECTPAEYIALCLHFNYVPYNYEYYKEQTRLGVSGNTNHYFKVSKFANMFPRHGYYIDCFMSE